MKNYVRMLKYKALHQTQRKETVYVSRVAHILRSLLGLGLFVLMVWVAYNILIIIWSAIISLPTETLGIVFPVIGTILVGVFSLLIGRYFERKKEIEQKQREEKVITYDGFIRGWFNLLMKKNNDTHFLPEFAGKIILWGPKDVIAEFSEFRKMSGRNSPDKQVNLMLQFEKVLFAMRKDLGSSNKDLKEGDLLALFINDIDEVLARVQAEEHLDESSGVPSR
jgi:hypothetical protein